MLRAVPDKLFGAVVMFSGVGVLALMPWLDRSKNNSIRYKGIYSKIAIICLVVSFSCLGYLGAQAATTSNVVFARIMTLVYFLCFILMPFYTKLEKTND